MRKLKSLNRVSDEVFKHRTDLISLWSKAIEVFNMILYISAIINAQYVIGTMLKTNTFVTNDDVSLTLVYNWIILEMAGYYSIIASTTVYILID